MPLFLYNFTTRELHGIFTAASDGDWEIDPYGAWAGRLACPWAPPAWALGDTAVAAPGLGCAAAACQLTVIAQPCSNTLRSAADAAAPAVTCIGPCRLDRRRAAHALPLPGVCGHLPELPPRHS